MISRGNETFEHTADIGVRGWGPTPEIAIGEAAAAMFSVMSQVGDDETDSRLTISAHGLCLEELLVEFLNELISTADINGLLFTSVESITIAKPGEKWDLEAVVSGIDRTLNSEKSLSEIKGATWLGVVCQEDEKGIWNARCVLDI
ncbi:MAG: archease [Candidatus Krumholzibacteriota bacterium]|nr:archease [Candidatus Krumholzibacteriota bacterium]